MVLARRDWPSPPISSAVYLTSFGPCGVSKIRQENNNVRLSTSGELMKGGGRSGGRRSGENEHEAKKKIRQLFGLLEHEELQRSILFFNI